MKKLFTFLLVPLICFIVSCEEKEVISMEKLYSKLPSVEYVSNNYTVNNSYLNTKMVFDTVSSQISEAPSLIIKYNDQQIADITHTDSNSSITIFASDTRVGDICSVFESQGHDNNYLFINGKDVSMRDGYFVVDFKIYNNNFFLALSNSLNDMHYKIYK